ncbi:DUF11 domain-containing protein [Hassallia byssoidea VB512170]|uniref:DUF11 domain-containing protein n=2 Tax=Hassallia TaxID=482629 RepID=A0A846HDM3_9CYAN|nr:DUF11 domain-containing protein [Hassalia byssoidea VB512170]
MRLIIKRWRCSHLLLFLLLPGMLTWEAKSAVADEIVNTAVFGGDNIQNVNTNRTSLTTDVAALQIIKSGDRAAAEPGDTVIYRVSIRNTGGVSANNLTLTDILPLGLQLITRSPQATLTNSGTTTPVTISTTPPQNRTFTINAASIPAQATLNVVYAATVTPDAVRGTGRNLAVANAGNIKSNTASYLLKIRPGIISDCATLIGRVFVDKNFDGEQQPGEPGIPNAVVYMDDGNRIVTDANGLFSLANVISGDRTGTLDLTTLPGYAIAPNFRSIQKNSQSRLVRLAPGGMARMNFAVTPAFREGRQ